jgi:hypothetical protein
MVHSQGHARRRRVAASSTQGSQASELALSAKLDTGLVGAWLKLHTWCLAQVAYTSSPCTSPFSHPHPTCSTTPGERKTASKTRVRALTGGSPGAGAAAAWERLSFFFNTLQSHPAVVFNACLPPKSTALQRACTKSQHIFFCASCCRDTSTREWQSSQLFARFFR